MPFIGTRLKQNDWPIEYVHTIVSYAGITIVPAMVIGFGVNAYLVFLVISTLCASVVAIQSAVTRAYWLLAALRYGGFDRPVL